MTSHPYMGPSEVQALIGRWHNIIGADVVTSPRPEREGWGERRRHRHHHHHHQEWGAPVPYAPPPPAPYQAPYVPPSYAAPYVPPVSPGLPYVRDHRMAGVGSWYSIVGADGSIDAIPPRNALIDAASPSRAGREVLPMSTGVAILPTQSAQITARPQRVAFRPERVFISAAGTTGGAADWIVNDIKIGNRSQFSQSGDIPGDMFATNAIDGFVSFETAQTAMDVVMVVTYIGSSESGVPFYASIVGTAAI